MYEDVEKLNHLFDIITFESMEKPLYSKQEPLNVNNPTEFISETTTNQELIQKELSVNQAEQLLLKQRIEMMKEFINELPSSDPQYSMLVAQVQMDLIELDELKIRESVLVGKIVAE